MSHFNTGNHKTPHWEKTWCGEPWHLWGSTLRPQTATLTLWTACSKILSGGFGAFVTFVVPAWTACSKILFGGFGAFFTLVVPAWNSVFKDPLWWLWSLFYLSRSSAPFLSFQRTLFDFFVFKNPLWWLWSLFYLSRSSAPFLTFLCSKILSGGFGAFFTFVVPAHPFWLCSLLQPSHVKAWVQVNAILCRLKYVHKQWTTQEERGPEVLWCIDAGAFLSAHALSKSRCQYNWWCVVIMCGDNVWW